MLCGTIWGCFWTNFCSLLCGHNFSLHSDLWLHPGRFDSTMFNSSDWWFLEYLHMKHELVFQSFFQRTILQILVFGLLPLVTNSGGHQSWCVQLQIMVTNGYQMNMSQHKKGCSTRLHLSVYYVCITVLSSSRLVLDGLAMACDYCHPWTFYF